MKKIGGYLLTATAFIACPCHLVFLLPLAAGLLGGTALGASLAANTGWVIAATSVYFVGALAGGLYLLNRRKSDSKSSPVPSPHPKTETTQAPVAARDRASHGSHRAGVRE